MKSRIIIAAFFLAAAFLAKVFAAEKSFTFNNTMSKETLRNYASRAISMQGFCIEGLKEDAVFEEDIRMLRHIGAKFIGRTAFYSWSGNLSQPQIDRHYQIAKEKADKVHAADPEMILQAGVFEIIWKGTVDATPIPDWVFKAFDQPVVTRNFRWENMLFPSGSKYGPGFFGNSQTAVPYIPCLETQMYFYYCICRYIDAGYESIHFGQGEMMMDYNSANTHYWDKVITMARQYAKTHARRGLALFDCHVAIKSPGLKIGNRLICDLHTGGIEPNETEYKDSVFMAEISSFRENWTQYIGRTGGGEHPLGFSIEKNYTLIEFDNYNGHNGKPGMVTTLDFWCWGYDHITWFATQPEWYRNQFLLYCDDFVKTNELDSNGNQVYFIQMPGRRVIVLPEDKYLPVIIYKPTEEYNADFLFDYLDRVKTKHTFDGQKKEYMLKVTDYYRANRQSDGCPNGFGQEDTIRRIFLGKNFPEVPELLMTVLPSEYTYP